MNSFDTQNSMIQRQQGLFMDLRKEVKELFYGDGVTNGFSFDVLLRKVDKTQHAPGYDPLKKETSADEAASGGKIWLTYDRIVKTVKRKYVGKEQLTDIGQLETDTTLFFFEHNVHLTEEDSIIEVRTDELGNIVSPVEYIKKYSIKDAEIMRGNNGRVEFTQVYAAKAE